MDVPLSDVSPAWKEDEVNQLLDVFVEMLMETCDSSAIVYVMDDGKKVSEYQFVQIRYY